LTVAIGTYFIGGVIISADTNVVATDGIVTSGEKVLGVRSRSGSYAIANAAEDGNAANMLGQEIIDELARRRNDQLTIEVLVKRKMRDWHSAYTQNTAPPVSFVLAASVGNGDKRLYFCEPPNTVLQKHLDEVLAIGVGARIVEPLVPSVVPGPAPLRLALFQVAYLMYRAKRDHIYLRGSDTHAMVLSLDGSIHRVAIEEMTEAERLCREIDRVLQSCFGALVGRDYGAGAMSFSLLYEQCKTRCDALEFRSVQSAIV
jgi:hypothetical protein